MSSETIHRPRAAVLKVYPEDQASLRLLQIPYPPDRSLVYW
jgi:hypothetical protein